MLFEPFVLTLYKGVTREPVAGDEFVEFALEETPSGFIVTEVRGVLKETCERPKTRSFTNEEEAKQYLRKLEAIAQQEGFKRQSLFRCGVEKSDRVLAPHSTHCISPRIQEGGEGS
jgi:hypothetical protein